MRRIGATLALMRTAPLPVRLGAILFLAALAVAVVFARSAIFHGRGTYGLADRRELLGIPNALDVLSNLPFALVGGLGLARARLVERAQRLPARIAFLAIGCAALGSSYYHLAPDPGRLLLDRLPITVAFMSIFAWVLGDRLGPRWGTRALAPLVGLGLAALWTWRGSGAGDGDLRPYVLVQAVPLACIPVLLALFPGQLDGRRFAWALFLYLCGKLTELFDAEVFALGGLVGGHALKHLLSAAACACLVPVEALSKPGWSAQDAAEFRDNTRVFSELDEELWR
jgi:hypothetical protein